MNCHLKWESEILFTYPLISSNSNYFQKRLSSGLGASCDGWGSEWQHSGPGKWHRDAWWRPWRRAHQVNPNSAELAGQKPPVPWDAERLALASDLELLWCMKLPTWIVSSWEKAWLTAKGNMRYFQYFRAAWCQSTVRRVRCPGWAQIWKLIAGIMLVCCKLRLCLFRGFSRSVSST